MTDSLKFINEFLKKCQLENAIASFNKFIEVNYDALKVSELQENQKTSLKRAFSVRASELSLSVDMAFIKWEKENQRQIVSPTSKKGKMIYFEDRYCSVSSMKWIIDEVDVSNKVLLLRQCVLKLADEGQILTDHHFLLLNYVVYFDSRLLILYDLGLEDKKNAMKKKLMRGKFDHCCNDNVIILCHLLMKRATRDDSEDDNYSEGASFELFLLNEKTEAIEKKDNDKILLVDIFGFFYKKIFFMSSLTEQSHIESTLMPFIETFFNCIPSTEHLSARGQLEELPESSNLLLPICKSSSATSTSAAATTASRKRSRASSSLSSSPSWLSLFPDYLLKIVSEGEKFDVLAAEIKKPNSKSSQIVNDRVKLGNLLKLMLDRLVLAGVPSPLVCGFVDDGDVIETYKMSIEQEGRYDFVQLASFRGIRCLEDLACLPNMLNHFQQLKNIVLYMKEVIRVTRLNEVIPGPFSLSLPVPVAWLRPSLEYPALEACSKKQK